nr:BrnA antitoxin family protein [Candidatus Levybacteria bacterium]
MKKKDIKLIPRFKNEDEERDFWATHDATDYFDQFKPVEFDLSELKFSTETISLRLPQYLLARIKELANKKDVPYQSLMKIFLAEKVEESLRVNK